MKIVKILMKLYKWKVAEPAAQFWRKGSQIPSWIMQGYTGALSIRFLRDLWFSVRTNAHKIPSILFNSNSIYACKTVVLSSSLSQVCESWDWNAEAMAEGAFFTSNLDITPHIAQENKARMWAAVVSLYLVYDVKDIIVHPTNSKLLMKGKEGWLDSAECGICTKK